MPARSAVLLLAVLLLTAAAAPSAGQAIPELSTTFIDFGTIPVSVTLTKSFWVRNTGDVELLSLVSSTDVVRFEPAPTLLQVPAGDSLEVSVTYTPINFADHSAQILVRSIGAVPESLFVDVIGTGGPDTPTISVVPPSFNVVMREDRVEPRNLRITNTGGGLLSWFFSEEPAPGVPWLSQVPTSGTLAPLAFTDADVTFNTNGLSSGVYATTLRVNSVAGDVDVPVTLLVEGTPNITVSASSLDFGRVYHGFSLDRNFTVFNTGTAALFVDSLRITSIGGGNSDYGITPPRWVLQPGQWVEVTVTLTPTVDGPITGNARVESNDPDQPFIDVALTGEGSSLSPPLISVLPDTISVSLFTGQIEYRDLVVGNSGGDSLVWTASAEWANLNPFEGLRVAFDQSHGVSGFFNDSSSLVATLRDAGATVTPNYARISLPVLLDYDVLYVPSLPGGTNWGTDEIEAAVDYVHALGGILMDATSTRGFTNANAVSAALGAGMTTGWGWAGGPVLTSYIQPSPITAGVDVLYLEHDGRITALDPPAKLLVQYDQLSTSRHSGYAEFGGRFMISTDEFHANTRVTQPNVDNLAFAMQAFGWLGRALSIAIDNTGSAVAAGAEDTIGVVVDATSLPAGSYPARIVINNNDPLNQSISVPVTVSVTGTAVIEVSDTSIAFNDRYVGVAQQKTITIGNVGLEPLSVTAITLPNPDFSWTSSDGVPPFLVATSEVETLYVTFHPVSAGPHTSDLTITSNAFNDATLAIALTGTGIEPVSLSADPDSIHVTLTPDDSASVELAIHNAASRDETVRMAFHETTGGPAQTGVFFDNFEDVDLKGWTLTSNTATKEVAGAGGGNNSLFAYRESNSVASHYTGIYQTLPGVQPRAVSFWVRPDRVDQYTNYVTLRDGAEREIVFFFATGNGTFYINANVGGNQSYSYMAGGWYHIEFRDIDWVAKNFDYVVNDSLVQADVAMRNPADVTEVSRMDLYHFTGGASGSFDDIWIDYGERPGWLSLMPGAGTVPGGGSAPFPVSLTTDRMTDGRYTALVSFASNDPLEPLLSVPVVLAVDSTATAAQSPQPRQTALLQNHPNPFNPSTTIRFHLATRSDIRLDIYSVRGQRVRALASGAHPAGSHAVSWDGRNDRGASVASGVYFYRLVAGRFVETRKMVLLK